MEENDLHYEIEQRRGLLLAKKLRKYANRKDVLILALPRGGVPVGLEVANA